MYTCSVKLTVLFEEPFWIAVYERKCCGKLEVCKITFGQEPKDYEVYQFMLENWSRLKFTPSVETEIIEQTKVNPKRIKRQINQQIKSSGIGTKAQQALKLQQGLSKKERLICSKERKQKEKLYKFEMQKRKHKEKHKGH